MIYIFGNGWIAYILKERLNVCHQNVITTDVNILDVNTVKSEMIKFKPDVVINCAAVCGKPNIDWCEENETNKRLTYNVNALGPKILLDAVRKETDAFFVQMSSGCLWNRTDISIDETITPEPTSFYSYSKYMGEQNIQGYKDVLIPRIRMPIDYRPNVRNLIDKLKKCKYVIDIPNSVTIVDTLVETLVNLISKKQTGIHHIVDGDISAYQIMEMYDEIVCPVEFEKIDINRLYELGYIKSERSNCRLTSIKPEGVLSHNKTLVEKLENILRRYEIIQKSFEGNLK